MHLYFTIISLIAGICLGFAILYLFVSLRRKTDKRLSFTFSLFAICYAITLINGIRWYSSNNVVEHIAILRFDAIFVAVAYIALIWYIAFYSGFQPRIFLWVLTISLIMPAFIHILFPAAVYGEVLGLTQIILPRGDTLNLIDLSGSFWYDLILLARFISLGYIILAIIIQYRQGDRQPALILGLGLSPFIIGIGYEIFGEIGFIPYIPLGEIGFLGIAIAASIQMASSVLKTEEELELHRNNLEELVDDRTQELENTANALRQSERRFRALLDAPRDTAMLVTPDGDILATNQIGANRLGLSTEDAIGKNVFDFFEPELAAVRKSKENELVQTKQLIQWEDQRDNRFYRNRMYPIVDDQGEVESVAVFAADITAQKLAEFALKESEAKYRDLVEKINDVIYAVDTQGVVTYVSPAIEGMIGYPPKKIIGQHFSQFIPQETINRADEGLKLAISGETFSPNEYLIVTRSGKRRWVRISSQPIEKEGQVIGAQGVITDISEQKKLQIREMESAAAEERSRLARDLHDAVTQTIYSASLISEVLPQVWDRNPEEGKRNLTKLRALVRGALAEMRTMLFELRPTALETADFEILLGQLGDALHGRTRIPVQIECDEIPTMIPPVKVALYRIAQEAINNIIKHAGATQTQIELREQSGQISLRIWDNGRGFDPKHTRNGGLGLGIMQERATNIRAEFEVESQPGRGTQVTVILKEPTQEEPEV